MTLHIFLWKYHFKKTKSILKILMQFLSFFFFLYNFVIMPNMSKNVQNLIEFSCSIY